jgi:hypothetical protein
VTSFIKDSAQDEVASSIQVKMHKRPPAGGRNRSGSGGCPKSLTPALEPSLSLVVSCDTPVVSEKSCIGSPKLIPPSDPDRLCSFSDASSSTTESENQAPNSDSSHISESNFAKNGAVQSSPGSSGKLPFVVGKSVKPSVSESSVSVDLSKVERVVLSESASEHLTKLVEQADDKQEVAIETEQCADPESKSETTS